LLLSRSSSSLDLDVAQDLAETPGLYLALVLVLALNLALVLDLALDVALALDLALVLALALLYF